MLSSYHKHIVCVKEDKYTYSILFYSILLRGDVTGRQPETVIGKWIGWTAKTIQGLTWQNELHRHPLSISIDSMASRDSPWPVDSMTSIDNPLLTNSMASIDSLLLVDNMSSTDNPFSIYSVASRDNPWSIESMASRGNPWSTDSMASIDSSLVSWQHDQQLTVWLVEAILGQLTAWSP